MFDLRHTLDLIDDGALDEAIMELERATMQMPAYTPAYVLLAQTYEAQNRWTDALKTWQQARFFAPNSPTIEDGLLRALEHQPLTDDASSGEAANRVMDRMADELFETLRSPESATSSAETASEASAPSADSDDAPPSQPETSSSTPTDKDDTDEAEEQPPEAAEPDTSPPEPPAAEPRPSPLDELARRLPEPDHPLPDDLEDLDRLIDELEGARIDPQPDIDNAPEPNLENDVEDMVSETLARIYISQNQYEEAARVYLRLASQEPEHAEAHRARAAELREQARNAREDH